MREISASGWFYYNFRDVRNR